MTWGAVAVAGATVVTGVMAKDSADGAQKSADKANKRSLAFEREKYEEWQATYGGLEDNMAAYYNQLTPEFYATQGLEAFQKEQQVAQERIKTSLAQRGIEDSGIALALEHQTAQEGAETRARIRAEAPGMAMQEKQGFLNAGLGLQPGQSYSTALSNQANVATQRANVAEQAAGQVIGTAVSTVGKATMDYLNRPQPTYTTDYSSPITNRPLPKTQKPFYTDFSSHITE